tara:strand:+ start:17040 stop:17276 length:237 start_codon:yes stop_codon:yes gene_type:complete
MRSRTLELIDFFEHNFSFDEQQLSVIKQISLETGIDENIVKQVLTHLLKVAYKELLLSYEDEVTIRFPTFNLSNIKID